MKWINQNKFFLAVCVIALLAYFCFRFFMQSIRTDHSMELFKQKMEYREQERQAVIKERQAWEQFSLEQTKQIITLQIRDSILSVQASAIEQKIYNINKPEYVKQKIKEVQNLDADGMLDYIRRLPEPNDY